MTDIAPRSAPASPVPTLLAAVFAGDGAMARRCRALDWAATPLGPVAGWSQSLRTTAATVLATRQPMFLFWGPEHTQLYNDAYRPSFGGDDARADRALGAAARAFWTEIWADIGPQIAQVMGGGEATWHEDQRLVFERHGRLEDVWWTYSYSPVPDDDGRVGGVLVVCQETTARVRAEAALRQSEAKFRALFESMIEAYCVIEMIFDDASRPVDFLYVETNAAFAGQATMPMLGRRIRDLVPDFERFWIDRYGQVALTGEPVRLEHVVAGLGDQWFHTSAFRVGDDGSRRVGVLFENITERKRAEAARERLLDDARAARAEAERARAEADEARRSAEASSRAKSEFLAVMSHELRTPLNAIGGYAELIEMGIRGPVTAQQREDLARIQRSQRHLLGLVNEVLNYTRLETGAVTYDAADVPVADAVAAAEALVAPQLRAKGLGYTWAGADPGPDGRPLTVRADRDKLQQILLNVLSNAVKFTGARDGRPGHVEVGAAAVHGGVRVYVRDTGMGIPADKLGAVFEPFVQVDAQLTRTAAGAGLGLAISRDLARGMGGDLTVESTPGAGSTFTLTLPAAASTRR